MVFLFLVFSVGILTILSSSPVFALEEIEEGPKGRVCEPEVTTEEANAFCDTKYARNTADHFFCSLMYLMSCGDTSSATSQDCDNYCKISSGENSAHAIWDGRSDYSEGCGCECEKGWTWEGSGCVSCEDFCGREGDHFVYNPDLSYTDVCECKCKDGYKSQFNEFNKRICKKVYCPENSIHVDDLPGSSLPPNDRKLSPYCYCEEGYIPSWGVCVIEGEPTKKTTTTTTIDPFYNESKNYCGPGGFEGPNTNYFTGADFNYACYEHDECYGLCMNSQEECDSIFKSDMRQSCRKASEQMFNDCRTNGWYNPLRYICYITARIGTSHCYEQAEVYYKGVAAWGKQTGSYRCDLY